MFNKDKHNKQKAIDETYKIAVIGHDARIKEQKKAIIDAKTAIKKHKLLKKQAKTMAKLKSLEI